MRRFMILFLLLFTAVFVFGDMLHSDYQVSNDRVYLINPIFYENIKVKDAGNGRYEVTDTGDFNFISNSGRNIAFSLKNGELTGSFTEYYENGLKLSEGSYVNGKKNGKWYTYNDSGRRWIQETYKDGKLDGEYVEWYSNTGQEKIKGNYVNNKRVGKWNTYYTNGQKESEGSYSNNQKDGKWTTWYNSGIKKLETEYSNGEISGDDIANYENGNVFYKGKYRNGEGSVVSYFSSGELKFEGNYKLRKKEGTWKYFDKSGNIVATEIYNNGILQY